MPAKRDHETENRGTRYEPSKRPDQYAQNTDMKPPQKKDRARDNEDNKTS